MRQTGTASTRKSCPLGKSIRFARKKAVLLSLRVENKVVLMIGTILLIAASAAFPQEVPLVQPLKHDGLRREKQSWSIAEDCEGYIYVATSTGVLIYNGFHWITANLPLNRVPRAVFAGRDCKIYVCGYETFGYYEYSGSTEPVYVPVGDSVMAGTNEEMWKMYGNAHKLIVQSFSDVYAYDYNSIEALPLRSNVMLGNHVDDQFFLPEIAGGIYQIVNDTLIELYQLPGLTGEIKVSDICQGSQKGELILATEKHGLFRAANGNITPVTSPDLEKLAPQQINTILRLKSGHYVIGTILNGIYITRDLNEVQYHINKNNGLSDNTVLSLYEDQRGDVWVGLDNGLDIVRLSSPVRFYYDASGILGTVYAHTEYMDRLYLATNHGIFRRDKTGSFQLMDNTQGQAWTFCKFRHYLLCGHNNGTYLVMDDRMQQISTVTGGWWMEPLDDHRILESTYTGLILLEVDESQNWTDTRVINGNILMRKFVLAGEYGLGYHPRYGLSIVRFGPGHRRVQYSCEISEIDGQLILPGVGMFTSDGRIIVAPQKGLYEVIDTSLVRLSDTEIAGLMSNPVFARAYNAYTTLMASDEEFAVSNLDHVSLGMQNTCLVSRDEGYEIKSIQQPPNGLPIEIDYVLVNDRLMPSTALSRLKPMHRNITVQFKNVAERPNQRRLWYNLDAEDRIWQQVPSTGELVFRNLSHGDYTLRLKDMYGNQATLARFSIPPHWYLSWQGGLLYAVVLVLAFWLWNKQVKRRMAIESRRMLRDKEKELEAERIRSNNERLEREIRLKSKLLANRAMALVQKNKLLDQLKEVVQANPDSNGIGDHVKSRIIHMVDQHADHEDEWVVFQNNFDEVHEKFTERLLASHPDLTSGEKRLAAFIRMDLSSKEIAPLLSISVRSVENKRHRLRKKMNLEFGESLTDYLMRL